MAAVKHHVIDFLDPLEKCTVLDFRNKVFSPPCIYAIHFYNYHKLQSISGTSDNRGPSQPQRHAHHLRRHQLLHRVSRLESIDRSRTLWRHKAQVGRQPGREGAVPGLRRFLELRGSICKAERGRSREEQRVDVISTKEDCSILARY